MNKKIYISGMHSGQNPCSGIGIARCLRKAFPTLTLVGVDNWQGSSGLHDSTVNEVLLLPQWSQMDDKRHSAQVRSLLDAGNIWISALDMEVHWFSENLGRHRNLLAPGSSAIELTAKPAVKALSDLGFSVPDYIPCSLPDTEIHAFLRHNAWQCWLKSPFHDAKKISSWGSFERAREALSKTWKTSMLFLQRHVLGNEETITFTAYQGELLYAVHLEKRQITPEGKTWAGHVTPVDPETFEHLKIALRRLEWSGGGELEFVRDPDGKKWTIECNPRFPAWIYGAALAGMNLPAKLISRVLDLPLMESVSRFPFFTRVVQEISAKEAVGIPPPPDPSLMVWSSDGKKGKGGEVVGATLPELNDSEDPEDQASSSRQQPEQIPELYQYNVDQVTRSFQGETPQRVHLDEWTLSRFQSLADHITAAHSGYPAVRIGYSVKTSPTDEHLRKAKDFGFYAECISQMEVHRARDFGFPANEIILNGPGKFWPLTGEPVTGLHMLFCDSVEEFDRVREIPGIASCLGFRIRLPKLHSRFGNSIDDFGEFQRIVSRVRHLKGSSLGFHFHMPSWAIGVKRWVEALQSMLIWCQTFQDLSGVPIKHLDLGGGFFPADLERLDFRSVQEAVATTLPHVNSIYFEPGRSLTQEGEILISRILDARKDPDGDLKEVVVDACIAELPLALSYVHKIFHRPKAGGKSALLTKGAVRILGRICMEDDILSGGVQLPENVNIGDFIIFGDAGGYERTMSYGFGRG